MFMHDGIESVLHSASNNFYTQYFVTFFFFLEIRISVGTRITRTQEHRTLIICILILIFILKKDPIFRIIFRGGLFVRIILTTEKLMTDLHPI